MDTFRTRQQKSMEDDLSNLVTDDRGEREIFMSLASDTFTALNDAGSRHRDWIYRMCPSSAMCLSFYDVNSRQEELPEPLQARWIAWRDTYAAMLDRNPRLEIVDMLEQMSESHDSSSWPYGREVQILEWVVHGDYRYSPMSLRGDTATR